MTRLSERDVRTLKFGCAVIAALVLGFRTIPSQLHRAAELRDREKAIQMVASRTANQLARGAFSRAGLQAAQAKHDSAMARILVAGAATTAASELAAHIAAAAEDAGVLLEVLIPEVDSAPVAGLRRVRVRCEGAGDIAGLASFLAFIEDDSLILRVPTLSVAASNPYAPSTEPERLRVTISVEALIAVRPDSGR